MERLVIFAALVCYQIGTNADSYMDAYRQSQIEKLDAVIVKGNRSISREFIESNDISDSFNNGNSYGAPPTYQYGPANPVYAPPSPPAQSQPPAYGPPPQQQPPAYGPPPQPQPPAYGPPSPPPPPPVYGPPVALQPIYGAPSSVQVFYGMPHALSSFWEKLKFKLDLFTVGKLLLKLVLFKKFVGWLALICLLFVVPTLKNKFHGEGQERRFGDGRKLDVEEINELSNLVYKALENFTYDSHMDRIYNQTFNSR
ncbi:unnamed protein product [Phyllotreta striolata]|uniref:Uncharacterized protein n=1 Tax=Phyllotreta striolata TaxID=444603 RepID=A0A9N9TI20_PHYSR|nr:unnamed protein product [Phyllotreta striolata]